MRWGPRILCSSSGKEPYFVGFFYNCQPTLDGNEVKALRIAHGNEVKALRIPRRFWQRALFCGVLSHRGLLLWGSFTIATLHWMSGNDVKTRHIARLFRKRALFCVRAFLQNSLIVWGYCMLFLDTKPLCCGFFLQRSLVLWGSSAQ